MTSDDPDRIRGLDLLDVPDQSDGFWDELHTLLLAAASSPVEQAPRVLDLGAARHRRRRRPQLAVAAVLIVIGGLVGLTLWRTNRPTSSGSSTPEAVHLSDPMAIDLDTWATGPADVARGTFTVFDTNRLPAGWQVRDTPVGAHQIDDPNPTHYGWNTAITTSDNQLVYLSASLSNDPAPGSSGTAVTVDGGAGDVDGDTLHWQDADGVRFSVISPNASADQLVQLADAIPLTTITGLHAPDLPAPDVPSTGQARLAGTIDGQQWQIVSADDATTSLTLVVGDRARSSSGGASRPLDSTYDSVVTGLGDHGAFLYGLAPATITQIRVLLDRQTVILPTGHDDNGTAIYAVPIPAGLAIRDIEFLTDTGHVAHRSGPPTALEPSTGTHASQDQPFDPPVAPSTPATTEVTTTAAVTTTSVVATTTSPTAMPVETADVITRPYVDPAACAAGAAAESESHDVTVFPFAVAREQPIPVQVLAASTDGVAKPFAVVLRLSANSRDVPEDHSVIVNGTKVGITTFASGDGAAAWTLPDGTKAYMRARDLDEPAIVALVARLTPRDPGAQIPGFDLQPSDDPNAPVLLHEHLNTGLSATVTTFQCESGTNQGLTRIRVIDGDPVSVYLGIIYAPRPYAAGVNGDGAITITNTISRGVTLQQVTNADPATWTALPTIQHL